DEAMATRLVRDGVQDFLLKKQVDCAPLAHAIRNAVERHRQLTAARAAAMTDSLTGLLNRSSFLTFGDRDRKLAERLGRRLMVYGRRTKESFRDRRRVRRATTRPHPGGSG